MPMPCTRIGGTSGGHNDVVGGGGDAHAQHDAAQHSEEQGDDQLTVGDLYDGGDEHIGQTGHRHHAGDDARDAAGYAYRQGIPGPGGQGVHIGGGRLTVGLAHYREENEQHHPKAHTDVIQVLRDPFVGLVAQDHDDSQGDEGQGHEQLFAALLPVHHTHGDSGEGGIHSAAGHGEAHDDHVHQHDQRHQQVDLGKDILGLGQGSPWADRAAPSSWP